MMPEAAAATPFDIFMLAENFFRAAGLTHANRIGVTHGPTRLLCYHACELYLKAYLRERGENVETLRAYGHDLALMVASAQQHGLVPRKTLLSLFDKVTAKNDYVRVRYMVSETADEISAETLLVLTERLRHCIEPHLGALVEIRPHIVSPPRFRRSRLLASERPQGGGGIGN